MEDFYKMFWIGLGVGLILGNLTLFIALALMSVLKDSDSDKH